MEITQDQADKFCSSLKSFHDSLGDDEKQVLEQVLAQAAPAEAEAEAEEPDTAATGRPFFERFLTLNPETGGGREPGQFVTLKFPSDSDEPGPAY